MRQSAISISSRLWAGMLAAAALGLVLPACGGADAGYKLGELPNSTPSPQIAAGVVTGFGSVFVDGVEIEDANASVITEDKDGRVSNSVLQMGQNIRVEHDGKGTASRVTVDAAIIGAVGAINSSTQSMTVAAQKVSVNADANAGPLTVWAGGYSSIADVQTGDLVQVHGSPVYDSISKTYQVLATRIQKTTSIASLKINGNISSLDTTAKTFTLNNLSVSYASASLRPAGAALSNDLPVTVFAPLSALTGSNLAASNIKLNRLQNTATAASQAQIGGPMSRYDSAAGSFEIQGVKVLVGTTAIIPSGARLANAAYVQVKGTLNADGSITANSIIVRQQNSSTDLAKVQLIGVISDFVDNSSFVVRGVPVDASAINTATSCPGVTLGNGVPVKVSATQQADTPVVLASALACQPIPNLKVRPQDGTVSDVSASAKTFSLGSQTVQWNEQTAFVGTTSDTMSGQAVRIEGYLSGATVIARVISAKTVQGELDDDHFRGASEDSTKGWDDYRKKRHDH